MDSTIDRKALWSKLHGFGASWDSCVQHAKTIELEWNYDTPTPIATMPRINGWRAPLWSIESNHLWLLRPEGVWRALLPKLDREFMLREHAESSFRGALFLNPKRTGKVWRLETGEPTDLDQLDERLSPPEIRLFADYVGALKKCGQDADGHCRLELDDHFERGPLSVRRHGPWLLISDEEKSVAYGLGEQSRMWKLLEENPCRVVLGSENFMSWLPRVELAPITMELSHIR